MVLIEQKPAPSTVVIADTTPIALGEKLRVSRLGRREDIIAPPVFLDTD